MKTQLTIAMKHLLIATAVIEVGTGLALLIAPAVTVYLLLGAEIYGAAIPIARITAAALLALGVACWFARVDVQSRAARGLVAAILVYDFGAVLVLGAAGIQLQTAGIKLWLAVVLHAALGVWCVALLIRKVQLRHLS
jgi:hypothetical protein